MLNNVPFDTAAGGGAKADPLTALINDTHYDTTAGRLARLLRLCGRKLQHIHMSVLAGSGREKQNGAVAEKTLQQLRKQCFEP
jgi:hypothetical protein